MIDTITAGGKLDTPVAQGAFTCVLGAGLATLQTAALATGFPFASMLVAMCCSIGKASGAGCRPGMQLDLRRGFLTRDWAPDNRDRERGGRPRTTGERR